MSVERPRALPARRDGRTGGSPRGVLVVAEQLRRTVPGGIGVAGMGLLQGLAQLAATDGTVETAPPATVPPVTLYASSPRAQPDPLLATGYPVLSAPLPSALLTRAWDRGLLRAPRGNGVVHALSLAAPPTAGTPLVVTVHDVAWRHHPEAYPRRGRRWHEAALGRALRRATRVVVPAETVAAELVAAGVPADAVAVVPLGCDHLPAPDGDGAASLLRRLGVTGDYLLAVGTLEPRKNLQRLFEAYRAAQADLPQPWPLVVVGPSGWGRALRPRAGVVMAGAVGGATLAALYARARLLAYVPLEEGFGLPPVEAMRQGTPVVASPVPSTGGAAFEVDPLDVTAMRSALVRVAGDDEVRDELARAGTARAGELTWRSAASTMVALWRTLL